MLSEAEHMNKLVESLLKSMNYDYQVINSKSSGNTYKCKVQYLAS